MFTQDMKELVGRDGDATKASPKVSVAASAEGSLAQGTPSNVDKNKKVRAGHAEKYAFSEPGALVSYS